MYIDKKLTQRVQKWLKSPEKYVTNIEEGATLLLKFTRNQFLYASALRNPERMKDKVAYELKKFLRLQLDGTTAAAVAKMVPEVMAAAAHTVAVGAPDAAPDGAPASEEGSTASIRPDSPVATLPDQPRLGRRADHDRLPAGIQALWTANGERWHKIRQAYNELQSLIDAHAQPCDLYERLKLLSELDTAYRADMAKYDAAEPQGAVTEPAAPSPEAEKGAPASDAAAPLKKTKASKE